MGTWVSFGICFIEIVKLMWLEFPQEDIGPNRCAIMRSPKVETFREKCPVSSLTSLETSKQWRVICEIYT